MKSYWLVFVGYYLIWSILTIMKRKSDDKGESLYYIAFDLVSYAVSLVFLVYLMLAVRGHMIFEVAFFSILLETSVVFILGCIKYKEILTFYTPREEIRNCTELLEKVYFATQAVVIVLTIICKIFGF
ncbi:MAG: hypothetical protein IJS47_07105 [Clostridia bacterium]|nr:hypothetical protein [Clostridia bacterium]